MTNPPATAVSRSRALELMASDAAHACLMVDTYVGAPVNMRRFCPLNPFTTWPSGSIPVPGYPSLRARSVEAVWQGLKLVDGELDLDQLDGSPKKRPSDSERRVRTGFDYSKTRFLLNGEKIDLATARFMIYLPTYLYLLDRLVPGDLIDEIFTHMNSCTQVVFYDWDSNLDIRDIRSSFSHSSILAAWFNGNLEREFVPKAFTCLPGNQVEKLRLSIDQLTARYNRYHARS